MATCKMGSKTFNLVPTKNQRTGFELYNISSLTKTHRINIDIIQWLQTEWKRKKKDKTEKIRVLQKSCYFSSI